jgi:nitrite reductase/ring-hydroxylating ferredoxin subunit
VDRLVRGGSSPLGRIQKAPFFVYGQAVPTFSDVSRAAEGPGWRRSRAVGVSADKPFAVSNRRGHLFASLGHGRETDDGCLKCPWHAGLYDVGTGAMVCGPQGAVKPLAGARSQKTFPVERRDGASWLVGSATASPRRRRAQPRDRGSPRRASRFGARACAAQRRKRSRPRRAGSGLRGGSGAC